MRLYVLLMACTLEVGAANRWPGGAPVPVWIDPANAPAGAQVLVERAVAVWTEAAGRQIRLEPTRTRADAKIRVHFAGRPGVYGETLPRLDPATGAIASADIVIATEAAGDDPLLQRIVLYLTALHELGHAIGLPHTDNFSDIMYSFRRPDDGERYFTAYRLRLRSPADVGSTRATGLSPNDIVVVRALYAP